MSSQEARQVAPCQGKELLERGPRAVRGGRSPGIVSRSADGRECCCTSPMANGKNSGELCTAKAGADRGVCKRTQKSFARKRRV